MGCTPDEKRICKHINDKWQSIKYEVKQADNFDRIAVKSENGEVNSTLKQSKHANMKNFGKIYPSWKYVSRAFIISLNQFVLLMISEKF